MKDGQHKYICYYHETHRQSKNCVLEAARSSNNVKAMVLVAYTFKYITKLEV